jgi:phosphatidylserine/phosphatidylglycerophosphate/cardiolipin synthase-like enzyme
MAIPCRDRSRRRRALAGLLGLLAAALAACGCGHGVTVAATRRAFDDLPAGAVLSAWVYRDHLVLRFRESGRQSVFEADWKALGVEKAGEERFRTAQLSLVEKLPKGIEEMRSSVREAAVASKEDVRRLLPALAERLVPAGAGQGVFLALGDREFVAYREPSGGARLVRAGAAPKDVSISRRINPTEFARELFALIEEWQRRAGDPRRLFLVVGGKEGEPPAYSVFDLDQRIVVVATWPGSADIATEEAASGKGLRMLEAAVLEGQVLSLLKNPISFVGRALNFALQTTKILLRKRSWAAPAVPPVVTEGPGMDLELFEAKLDKVMGSRRHRGSIRLLIDGPAFFPVLEQRIAEAKQSIHFRVCIWDTDDVAVDVADRVRKRSLEIPDTRVIVDRVTTLGSSQAPPGTPMPEGFVPPRAIQPYLRKDSKVRVRNFLNAMTMGDHSKVLLFDRRYALLGGMNLGREYRYEWHDVMVELEGPIVGWFERDFELAWSHASVLGDLAYAEAYLTASKTFEGPAEREDYVDLRPIYTKTLNPSILRALSEALRRARRYAWIENPYIYDDTVVRELVAARRRGVDVRVVMPSQADLESTDGNNKVKANRMLENGIRVYSYPGMLHTKAGIIDGWAFIGSCNFNKLSLRTNYEADVATSDPGFAERMRQDLFETDFARSAELTEPLPVTGSDRMAEWLAHQT